jgi:hypothetical protein
VTSYVRTIDIPQEWTRAETETYSREQPYNIVSKLALLVLAGLAVICFFRKSTGRKFSLIAALPWVLLLVCANTGVSLLWSDQALVNFQTTMGWWMQIGMMLVGLGIGASVMGTLIFLIAQALHAERPRVDANVMGDLILGASLALALVGYRALVGLSLPTVWAPTPYSADLATAVPWLTVMLNGVKAIFPNLMIMILALGLSRFLTKAWRWWLVGAMVAVWLIASSLASREFMLTFAYQLFTLMMAGFTFLLIRRQQLGVALAMLGSIVALDQLGVMRAIYAGAVWQGALSAVICLALTYVLLRHWYAHRVE